MTSEQKSTFGEWRYMGYTCWLAMIDRCTDPRYANYHRYGGRGIQVCDQWRQSYEAFLADMGERPSRDHSLDRIDNDGNYEPGNVRWATRYEQQHSRTSKVPAEVLDRILTEREAGLSYRAIAASLNDDGIATPLNKRWYGMTVKYAIDRVGLPRSVEFAN